MVFLTISKLQKSYAKVITYLISESYNHPRNYSNYTSSAAGDDAGGSGRCWLVLAAESLWCLLVYIA